MAKNDDCPGTIAIGELARRTNCSVPTLRYYESIGLLRKAKRRTNGYRAYDATALNDLNIVLALRASGMTLREIRDFQGARADSLAPCSRISDLARHRAAEIQRTILRLRLQEQRLRNFAEACTETCQGQAANACSVLPTRAKK